MAQLFMQDVYFMTVKVRRAVAPRFISFKLPESRLLASMPNSPCLIASGVLPNHVPPNKIVDRKLIQIIHRSNTDNLLATLRHFYVRKVAYYLN